MGEKEKIFLLISLTRRQMSTDEGSLFLSNSPLPRRIEMFINGEREREMVLKMSNEWWTTSTRNSWEENVVRWMDFHLEMKTIFDNTNGENGKRRLSRLFFPNDKIGWRKNKRSTFVHSQIHIDWISRVEREFRWICPHRRRRWWSNEINGRKSFPFRSIFNLLLIIVIFLLVDKYSIIALVFLHEDLRQTFVEQRKTHLDDDESTNQQTNLSEDWSEEEIDQQWDELSNVGQNTRKNFFQIRRKSLLIFIWNSIRTIEQTFGKINQWKRDKERKSVRPRRKRR